MQSRKASFRVDIEGFRAIAVLLVILFHARLLGCKGGFIGVDLFFVLSGYLITGLLIAETERTGSIGLVAFYARRARRLLPASSAMLLVTCAVAAWILPPFEQVNLSRSALAASAYSANLYFFRAATNYFAADLSSNPLLHTWSLAVEEQFYVMWPLLLLLVWRMRQSRAALCVTMAMLGVLSLAACVWVTRNNQPMTFYLMPFRGWEFAAGGLASQIPRAWLERRRMAVRWIGWIAFAVVLLSGWALSEVSFPGTKAMLPALAATLVLVAGSLEDRAGVWRLLQTRPLPYVGQRSYALYLWHWPILILASIVQNPLTLSNRLLCLATAFVCAEASFVLVEHPIRSNAWLQRRSYLCLGASATIAMAGVAGGLAWHSWAIRTPNFLRFGAAMADLPDGDLQGCLTPYGDANVHPCIFGSTAPNAQTLVLLGDSHMEQWLPAFEQIAQRREWKIVLMVKSACPALDIATSYLLSATEDRSCALWRQRAYAAGLAFHPSVLVLANASWYTKLGDPTTKVTPEEWSAGARRTFATLPATHPPVLFIRDTPFPGYDPALCLARADWNGIERCPALVRSEALNDAMFRAQRDGADGMQGIFFVDLTDRICGEKECALTRDGMIVYRDKTHLTATFARSLSGDVERSVEQNVPALAAED